MSQENLVLTTITISKLTFTSDSKRPQSKPKTSPRAVCFAKLRSKLKLCLELRPHAVTMLVQKPLVSVERRRPSHISLRMLESTPRLCGTREIECPTDLNLSRSACGHRGNSTIRFAMGMGRLRCNHERHSNLHSIFCSPPSASI